MVVILKTSRQTLLPSNAMKRSDRKCKTENRTNKLPGTKCSTCESLALSYTYMKHYYDHGSRKEKKRKNQCKPHKFLNFDDMIHKRAGLYLASLDTM